jgi:mono/diheme cytochrome c family protein
MAGLLGVTLLFSIPAASVRAQQPAPETEPPSADNIEKGKRDFVTYACYACHGHSGQGSDSGPRVDTNRLTLQAFSRYVRAPAGSMPQYKTRSQLPDSALADMYAFLESLPPPPDPKSIPLLNDDQAP